MMQPYQPGSCRARCERTRALAPRRARNELIILDAECSKAETHLQWIWPLKIKTQQYVIPDFAVFANGKIFFHIESAQCEMGSPNWNVHELYFRVLLANFKN